MHSQLRETLEDLANDSLQEILLLKDFNNLEYFKSWVEKNKDLEVKTIPYSFEENNFSNFWGVFYSLESYTNLLKFEQEILDCYKDFKSLKSINGIELVCFLKKHFNTIEKIKIHPYQEFTDYISIDLDVNVKIKKDALIESILNLDQLVVAKYKIAIHLIRHSHFKDEEQLIKFIENEIH